MSPDHDNQLRHAVGERTRRGVLAALAGGGAMVVTSMGGSDLAAKKKKKQRRKTWVRVTDFGTAGSGESYFSDPYGVAVSASTGTAWVADTANHRISVWARPRTTSNNWSNSTRFGSGPDSGDTNFRLPSGIAVSADGRTAWVADTVNHRISIWTRNDSSSTTWNYSTQFGTEGTGDTNMSYPTGVAVSSDGLTVWAADSNNHRIVIWVRDANNPTIWHYASQFGTHGTGDNNFKFPNDVATSVNGLTAWVADTDNSRVSIWTRPTTSSTEWTLSANFGTEGMGDANFNYPNGIAVASNGRTAWVADTDNNRIAVWTRPDPNSSTWSYSTQFGGDGSVGDNFIGPTSVAVSADGRTAYVADTGNCRISVWQVT